MKTNQVEKLLGISKQSILFYEKEGLINPIREENGYRDYQENDIQSLKLIILLRKMEISIDDIRLILNNQLSLNECLIMKEQNIKSSISTLNEIETMVQQLKEKRLPLIPAIASIDFDEHPFALIELKKTNKTVSLGRRMTKSYARKVLIWVIFVALIASLCLNIVTREMFHNIPSLIILTISFIGFMAVILIMPKFHLNMGTYPLTNMEDKYIEFLEDGVRFYQPKGIFSNFKYFIDAIFKDGESYLEYYKYQDIEQIDIKTNKRFITPGSSYCRIPLQIESRDFYFRFIDGSQFRILGPMILENDGYYIAKIIKEKPINVNDPSHYLDEFLNKEHELIKDENSNW